MFFISFCILYVLELISYVTWSQDGSLIFSLLLLAKIPYLVKFNLDRDKVMKLKCYVAFFLESPDILSMVL